MSLQRELADSCFLELYFAVSWDDEHGMWALLYKDRLLAFG